MEIIQALKPSRVRNPPPTIIPTQFILHSACDNYGVDGHLSWQYGQELESTVYFSKNGPIYQIMKETWRAQANYTANGPRSDGSGAISGESGSDIPALDPWSPEQCVAIIEYGRYLLAKYPTIARRICRSPTDPGIGYHTMWGAPSPWTPVAKTCPGPVRIRQFYDVIAPGILSTNTEWDDIMASAQDIVDAINRNTQAVVDAVAKLSGQVGSTERNLVGELQRNDRSINGVTTAINELPH